MSRATGEPYEGRGELTADGDVVLRELSHVGARYRELRAESEEQRRQLVEERRAGERLAREAADLRSLLAAAEARRGRAEQRRADLALHVREMHRAVFLGGVHQAVLEACVQMTGATRGLYLSCRSDGGDLRVRAAVGVEPGRGTAASEFVDDLAQRALATMDVVTCSRAELAGRRAEIAEGFVNCAAMPVVMAHDLGGILVVADKSEGDFDEDDLEALLAVGSHTAVAVENLRLQRQLQHVYVATLGMLADVVEAKDPSTRGHCELVSRYARLTAEHLGLDARQTSLACYGALLHDVGKIAVSDGVLHKPGPLLGEEVGLLRAHVRVGFELVRRVPALADVAEVVLAHHEWFDGSGYPRGLAGEAIPLPARIVAVVDAYCAMTAERSYKPPLAGDVAVIELRRCAGTQFDPRVVDAFLAVLASPAGQTPAEDGEPTDCGLLPLFARGRPARPAPGDGAPGDGVSNG